MNDFIITFNALHLLIAAVVLFLVFPLLKKLLWWLFRFDRRVKDLQSQKKSSEVRTGRIVETLAPILDDFPVDPKKPGTSTFFIGQPVDYIHFDPDEGVTFIEVKSANSKLSNKQKKLKQLIESGQVYWEEFRR